MLSVYDSDRNSCCRLERLHLASWELISGRCTADLKIHLNLYCILEKLIHQKLETHKYVCKLDNKKYEGGGS